MTLIGLFPSLFPPVFSVLLFHQRRVRVQFSGIKREPENQQTNRKTTLPRLVDYNFLMLLMPGLGLGNV